jgi:hypothetical protein
MMRSPQLARLPSLCATAAQSQTPARVEHLGCFAARWAAVTGKGGSGEHGTPPGAGAMLGVSRRTRR